MPNRIIREGILTSERIEQLSPQAELFYRRLMSVVDDFGRYDARPQMLRVSCFPLRVDRVREADITRWIAECATAGVIALYAVNRAGGSRWIAASEMAGPAVSGEDKPYLVLQDFRQQVRAKDSKFPQTPCECNADATQMISTCYAHAPVVEVEDGDEDEDDTARKSRRKKSTSSEVTVADMQASGASGQLADEYRNYRRSKRAPLTPRAWAGICKEVEKSGLKIDDALEKAMARGWQGFEAEWCNTGPQPGKQTTTKTCACGAPGVVMKSGKWFCLDHEPKAAKPMPMQPTTEQESRRVAG